ncbi:mechanosensitive ion channel family protein [Pradoshia sp. D12]|uniref:mechanosensitive ion channel family protein n=1 Tax=Pradoshia sp. D12 TaxID=2651284 RepID=UPI001CEF8F49|nr:mechanosensitive ion channel domain-containing protein [Pradoshia sp. D12]
MGFKFSDLKWETWLFDIGIWVLKIFLFYLIYKVIRTFTFKIIEKIFSRMQAKENLSENRTKTLESLTKNAFGYVFIFILIVTILEMLGINVSAILAGAGIVGLAVGFGAQGLVSDVVTGFFILLEKQIDVGDEVTIGVIKGVVEVVGLKTIQIRGYDGSLHYIPNRQIAILSNIIHVEL